MGAADESILSPPLSGAPSLASSKLEIDPEREPTREEIIAEFLEKAKFYTSVCLGELFKYF